MTPQALCSVVGPYWVRAFGDLWGKGRAQGPKETACHPTPSCRATLTAVPLKFSIRVKGERDQVPSEDPQCGGKHFRSGAQRVGCSVPWALAHSSRTSLLLLSYKENGSSAQ